MKRVTTNSNVLFVWGWMDWYEVDKTFLIIFIHHPLNYTDTHKTDVARNTRKSINYSYYYMTIKSHKIAISIE